MNKFFDEINESLTKNIDLNYGLFPNVKPGDSIRIYWDSGFYDEGYIFCLPFLEFDEGSVMVHVENPGLDEEPEVFIHSYALMSNKRVLKISHI